MMMRGDLLWRKAIQLLNRKYRSGGLCDPVTGDYIHQKPKLSQLALNSQHLYQRANELLREQRAHPAPIITNEMKCILPRHSCISYLKDVKIYESALGAEYQQEIDDGFEIFSKFIDENILRNS